jgi:hypothetical protein
MAFLISLTTLKGMQIVNEKGELMAPPSNIEADTKQTPVPPHVSGFIPLHRRVTYGDLRSAVRIWCSQLYDISWHLQSDHL